MRKSNKVLSLIGLAQKAGRLVSGEFSTEKAIKTGNAYLALVADDASENTQKKFRNSCEYYGVPVRFISNREELGTAIGRQFRASLAILDGGFAEAILKELDHEVPPKDEEG